jgi:hypothetical protein
VVAPTIPAPNPPRQQQLQPQRSIIVPSQPQTPITPQVPQLAPPPPPMYSQAPGMMAPAAISPRVPYPPSPYGFSPAPPIQQAPPLTPSALPRNFGAGAPPFDPSYSRGLGPAAPIGPPKTPITTSSSTMLPPGPSRRASMPDPGPVARPIAPIARPTGDASTSGSGSPNRRSPSPKGVLGSSALAADDDEVVPPPTRRVTSGAVGQGWGTGSPRSAVGENTMRAPWGPPAPPGFVGPPHPSVVGTSLWGNATANAEWIPPGGLYPSPFIPHNSSLPPHSGGS